MYNDLAPSPQIELKLIIHLGISILGAAIASANPSITSTERPTNAYKTR